jgi:hypothetical protein
VIIASVASAIKGHCAGRTRQQDPSWRRVNSDCDWRNLPLPEFIARYCRKPLNSSLRAIAKNPSNLCRQVPLMGELLTESQVRQLRLIGPQSAAEIIRAMEGLGWKPQLSSLDVSFALGSAVHSLIAKARRLGKAHPQAAVQGRLMD